MSKYNHDCHYHTKNDKSLAASKQDAGDDYAQHIKQYTYRYIDTPAYTHKSGKQ